MAPKDPALPRAHRLLRQSFHASELVGRSEWRSSLAERKAGLWSDIRWHIEVAEQGANVVGLATGTYLGNVNVGVIGYLAVAPSARGLGVGPKLRSRLRAAFRRDAKAIARKELTAVVGEVRRDNPWLRTLIKRDRVLALDFNYHQPRLRPDEDPVSLVMYYESLGRARRSLPVSYLKKLLYTIWRRVYRTPRPLATTSFRRIMRDLEGRTAVRQVRLKDLDFGAAE
ncbi:MAG: GNAT family N-acetyltransferase [Gemmatimonadales bacterium]